METKRAFNKRTDEDIYLEYFNDWLTVKAMAEHYCRPESMLQRILDKGREDHNAKFNTKKLPPILMYKRYLEKAVIELGITKEQARLYYGNFSISEWENLFTTKQTL